MSRLSESLNRAQTELESNLGSPTFTYASTHYLCTPSTLRRGNVLVIGGKEIEVALTLIVRKTLLATAPAIGKTLVFDSITYRVVNVLTAAGGSHFEIDLASPHR
jgi:hypothetical protein